MAPSDGRAGDYAGAAPGHILGPHSLEQLARELAESHGAVAPTRRPDLKSHVRALRHGLQRDYRAIATEQATERPVTPAAQWVLDNFHVITQNLDALAELLSPALLKVLPLTHSGHEAELRPQYRIHAVIRVYAANVDCHVQTDGLIAFLKSYQTLTPFTMAELWAVPVFLRLVLLETLGRIAEGTSYSLHARELADREADRILGLKEGSGPPMTAAALLAVPAAGHRLPFVVRFVERIRFGGEPVQELLDQYSALLHDEGLAIEDCVRREHQRQGANNVSAANCVTSLRDIEAVEWRDLFASLSVVEAILGTVASYQAVDQATRDQYRHAVAELARGSSRPEARIAEWLRELVAAGPVATRQGDIGWYLLADGRLEFEQLLGFKTRVSQRWRRYILKSPTGWYIGSILILTLVVLLLAAGPGVAGHVPLATALLLVLAAFPASELAVRLVNLGVSRLFPARPLPRLALAPELPPEARTLVVMPVMLNSPADVAEHVHRLEVHAEATPDPHMSFALLSDWVDSPEEVSPRDRELLNQARDAVADLNRRNPPVNGEPRFYLFHRRRLWSDGEQCWMGWERKRGKLVELNRLLTGAGSTSFLAPEEESLAVPSGIRFVFTVDADTRIPIGAARKLLGAALHPLNRPEWDEAKDVVRAGYGVLQPRVTPLLPEDAGQSIFQWAVSGSSGMDPYAGAVSDAYQDLFGRGIYTGKGLYDLHAFHRALEDRLPDNAVLSHDLLEGQFVRCALVSDVEVYEEFPSHSEVAAARAHRWTRGDWQLLPWLVGARGADITAVGRWQIFDNLRRSLAAPAALGTLLAAWCTPAARDTAWVLVVIAPLFLPGILAVLFDAAGDTSLPWFARFRSMIADLRAEIGRGFVALAFLGQNAWLTLDAVVRTLVRLLTRRRLLEWMTAAHVKAKTSYSLPMFAWPLRSSSVIVIAATALVLWLNPSALPAAAPWLILLWLAPVLARLLSLPKLRSAAGIPTTEETVELRRIARRTWAYFQTFVTAEDNHLPPDNFQEDPVPVVAHRTSPSNIGLYLLSAAAARDFGWVGLGDFCTRVNGTFDTLSRLERFRGHLLNWYDTRSLTPLHPRYVSVVDSGNLAGHLWALSEACVDFRAAPVLASHRWLGLRATLDCLVERLPPAAAHLQAGADLLGSELARLSALSPARAAMALKDWQRQAESLAAEVLALAASRGNTDSEDVAWSRRLATDALSLLNDCERLLPLALFAADKSALDEWESLLEQGGCYERLDRFPARCRAVARSNEAESFHRHLESVAARADALLAELQAVGNRATELAGSMDFQFLYDRKRSLFAIGYRVEDGVLDTSFYDLLASEARLASLVAIAEGQVPVRHWFRLGRPLGGNPGEPLLFSWSGSMFEYLMPSLVMQEPPGSLLATTNDRAVQHQMRYGRRRRLPWGVSESAFNVRDPAFTYQYADFGVPGLGLKRGLGRSSVVAPYATALASGHQTTAAVRNFQRLRELGAEGHFGYYDAVDFTPDHQPAHSSSAVVRTYMAHHQGMSLVAIGNTLHQRIMRRRFHRLPHVQAAELLLQERPPRRFRALPRVQEPVIPERAQPGGAVGRRIVAAVTEQPVAHWLSNGRYHVQMTAAGSGASRCRQFAISRWREDAVREPFGTFFYLRDVDSGHVWSAGAAPTGVTPDTYEAQLDEDRVRIIRNDGDLTTTLEVIVSSEDDAELRRLTLCNGGSERRVVEVTSYLEVVLAEQAADVAHPAFSNLFVETEYVPDLMTLLAARRPRSASEPVLWAAHVIAGSVPREMPVEFETDRLRFLGRGGDVSAPAAVHSGRPLGNSVGAVLDPIFSLRTRVTILPGAKLSLTFATLFAPSREEALATADRLNNPDAFERAAMLAWTYARAGLHFLAVRDREARIFQNMASHLLYGTFHAQAPLGATADTRLPGTGLWRFGISGDKPLVLVLCSADDHGEFADQLLRAQAFWDMKGLAVDLVLLNDRPHSYLQALQHHLEASIRASRRVPGSDDRNRGIAFALRGEDLSGAERQLLLFAARVVLDAGAGPLAEQVARHTTLRAVAQPLWQRQMPAPVATVPDAPESAADSPIGTMSPEGREYVITLTDAEQTPAPWVNVIANPLLGSLVSESGAGFTWATNSRENQLTPWANDPVTDTPGEIIYIRDEYSGSLWTPTPGPIRNPEATYTVAHGQGYSRFETAVEGISSELRVFVAAKEPVKFSHLRLHNAGPRARRLAVIAYVDWVLGSSKDQSLGHVVTSRHQSGALLARNPWNAEFAERVAFLDLGGRETSYTSSRREFFGRFGSPRMPAGLRRPGGFGSSDQPGSRWDTCGALLTTVDLAPGQSVDVVVTLGQGSNADECSRLIAAARNLNVDAEYDQVRERWNQILDAIQVTTPDPLLNHLMNRWLLYQVLSCRYWGRTGLYQAGGAFGFRDQLQDCLAVLYTLPDLVRSHLLLAASRQFEAGDVQHWWHPPLGRGVRTRCVDDRLWLPFVTLRYLSVTGDTSVLDAEAGFLADRPLRPEEDDAYFQPADAAISASLYEHCARALDASLTTGAHGLPLMGGGDWNDGMNRVGIEGRGESTWMAWFLLDILPAFADLAGARNENRRADHWRGIAEVLRQSVEKAWDGAWYRRGYFDDGSPLGTAARTECRIDSIAQSWGVLSGEAPRERAETALDSVMEHLVRPADGLVLLLTPPFDHSEPDPGYIRGYLPGLRENGGHYSHAAVWTLMAFARLGRRQQAAELLRMLNPLHRTANRAGRETYRVEPYAIPGDISGEAPNAGRGGWTWYTGAASWLYRAVLEEILGIRVRGDRLSIKPALPPDWPRAEVRYRTRGFDFRIVLEGGSTDAAEYGIKHVYLDEKPLPIPAADSRFELLMSADGREHVLRIVLG